jgi:hypothetical protein
MEDSSQGYISQRRFLRQEIPSPLIELIFLPHGTQITLVEEILLPLEATFLGPYFKTMWV